MASAEEVVKYLEDADFPAHRDDLVRVAEEHGAPEDVIKALRGMPPEVYANRAEVMRSAKTPAEPDEDPGLHFARMRDRKHERIAEPLRELPPEEMPLRDPPPE